MMHPSRHALVKLAQTGLLAGRLDARHVLDAETGAGGAAGAHVSWLSLREHSQWRYLIDLAGTGYSARLKLLPHADRPLLGLKNSEKPKLQAHMNKLTCARA